MQFFYNLGIHFYKIGANVFSLWNPKAKLFVNGRKNWRAKLKNKRDKNKSLLWFHCSSLGEFEQAKPVIEQSRVKYPNHEIAVSFYSPSGYEIRKNDPVADFTFYLPFDTKRNVNDLIEILNPDLLVLVKYEYWYNLISALQKKEMPIVVISAIFHEHQIFFKPFLGKWFRKKLGLINQFFVQNIESENLLKQIGINQTKISGDTRFDRVKQIVSNSKQIKHIQEFKQNNKLMIVGSSWQEDEQIILSYFKSKKPNHLKIIFAPHNLKEAEINKLETQLGNEVIRYTKIDSNTELKSYNVMILDTMGMLTNVYQYADFAYVGGGFTKSGVHNTLEPAVYGVPIIIGENYSKFQEAKDLVALSGIASYKTEKEFFQVFDSIFNNESVAQEMGKKAKDYVFNQPNATEIIIKNLNSYL